MSTKYEVVIKDQNTGEDISVLGPYSSMTAAAVAALAADLKGFSIKVVEDKKEVSVTCDFSELELRCHKKYQTNFDRDRYPQ